jgi:hypothetical protein
VAADKTTAELLESIWQRFAAQLKEESGYKVSKRHASQYYLREDEDSAKDAQALSRWTNPGERSNYRIPTWRIPVVANKLRATQGDVDNLMIARLGELAEANPRHEALVVGLWVEDFCERATRLSRDEQVVLDSFRASLRGYPHMLFDTDEGRHALTAFFNTKSAKAWKDHLDEHLADVSEEDEARMLRERKDFTARRAASAEAKRQEGRDKSKGQPLASVAIALLKSLRKRVAAETKR